MKAPKQTLAEAYREYHQRPYCGSDDWRRSELRRMLISLTANYREREWVPLLDRNECVALAKKLLSRALQREFTRKETEEFLGG